MDKREYFDALASDWDSFPQPEDVAAKRARFVTIATEGHPLRILDVGCGTGVLVPELLAQCPSATIVELDFSPEMIARNRAKNAQPSVQFLCSSIGEAPFEPASFDAILCFGILPHLDSLDTDLRKLASALTLRGRLSVGHLMGSAELNAFHAGLEGPINADRLPTVMNLADLLSAVGLHVQIAEESPDWYFVRAEKVCI
jgi:demethylmenaquinone methyltransferase/2-methoxy-6-polyprenyl-1,4-benzoquinol methylase